MEIRKAERKQKKLKMAIQGVSGAGKTWTALEIANGLKGEGRILLIDTERSSSELYADKFDFDVINLEETEVDKYLQALKLAVKNTYSVVIIDSLSHAWESLLEEHDSVTKKSNSKNSFQAWGEVTPIYKQLVQGIVSTPIHVIATMRSKSEYVIEQVERNGKTYNQPKKVGLAPVFRQGGEYEFDVVGIIDLEHNFVIEKSRIDFLADKVIKKPKSDLGEKIGKWLDSGKKVEEVKREFGYNVKAFTSEEEKKEMWKDSQIVHGIVKDGLLWTSAKLGERWDSRLVHFPEPHFDNDPLPEGFGVNTTAEGGANESV